MPWPEFERFFGSITVCFMVLGNSASSQRLSVKRHQAAFAKMCVAKAGAYTLSVYQESKRKYAYSTNYELSESRLMVARLSEKGLEFAAAGCKEKSNLQVEAQLSEGEYLLCCKIVWRLFEEHECVVAAYGPAEVQFKLYPQADPALEVRFKNEIVHGFVQQFPGSRNTYEKITLPEAYREMHLSIDHGIGYLLYKNPTSKPFCSTVCLKNLKGIRVLEPFSNPIEGKAAPGSTTVIGFQLSPRGYGYSLEEKMKLLPS